MNKTIFVTGSSSGIGKETVKYFHKKGWNVAATMRSPEKENELQNFKNVQCFQLDVTSPDSINQAIKKILETFGSIDVVVNNAGYGTKGLFEASTPEDARHQLEVNLFGVMNVVRAVLPLFRQKKSGTIINISSQAGVIGVPLNSLYGTSKFAIEGFSESLSYELSAINIKTKLILIAAIQTNFFTASKFFENKQLKEYEYINNTVLPEMKKYLKGGKKPLIVAKTIYKAATDHSDKLRYLAGREIKISFFLKKILPFFIFKKIIKKHFNI